LNDFLPHEFLFVFNAEAVVMGWTSDPDHPSQLPVPVTVAAVVLEAWRSLAAAVDYTGCSIWKYTSWAVPLAKLAAGP
jgi:hypothetical protein